MNRLIYSPRLTRLFYYAFIVLMFLSGYYVHPVSADDDLTLQLPNKKIRASLLTLETFTHQNDWEEYSSPNGVELGVENGVYRMSTLNQGYVWGLNKEQHNNVVLEVDVTPMSPDATTNAFGLMCRADESDNGDGYYFMINGNGYYSISIGQGEDIKPLVEWQASKAIHVGIDKNLIRAVCLDDSLALYVNDKLLIETHDDTYQSGYAGLAIAASPNTGSDVAFDNLATYEITNP